MMIIAMVSGSHGSETHTVKPVAILHPKGLPANCGISCSIDLEGGY